MLEDTLDVKWAYINKLTSNEEEIPLSGFAKFGSLGSENHVHFKDKLLLDLKYKFLPDPADHAAIIDIDFNINGTNHSWASLIYHNGCLAFGINDDQDIKRIWEKELIIDGEWHTVQAIANANTVEVVLDGEAVVAHTFKNKLNPCRVFIGNNTSNNASGVVEEDKVSLLVKDISLATDYGIFPLDISNVVPFPDVPPKSEAEK